MPKSPEQFNPTESREAEPWPKLGDYVTADLVEKTVTEDYPDGLNEARQGVFVKDNGNGTVLLQGDLEQYVCKGPKGMSVVPDEKLLEGERKLVIKERKKLGL